jgi:hypothetical protein
MSCNRNGAFTHQISARKHCPNSLKIRSKDGNCWSLRTDPKAVQHANYFQHKDLAQPCTGTDKFEISASEILSPYGH